jgi:tetratricopeptide (TPR) repeat protein
MMKATRRQSAFGEKGDFSPVFEVGCESVAVKTVAAFVLGFSFLLLLFLAVSNFIVGGLVDERISADPHALNAAVGYFPGSARLHFRLAAALEDQNELNGAELHALTAINASPYNYTYYLLLAQIQESGNDVSAAERSLRTAIKFAPHRTDVHWRLGNLLLRQGDSDEALEEFSRACSLDKRLLPVTLNLVWHASGEDLQALQAVVSAKPADRLALAQFLLKQSLVSEAAREYSSLGRDARIASAEGIGFLRALIAANRLNLARNLWTESTTGDTTSAPLIWNGSLESDISKNFPQFDWAVSNSEYAKVRIATDSARTGTRSLRMDFTGHDTTKLNYEIKQLIVARPGVRYRLECYAKAEGLLTTEGPRLAVTPTSSSAALGQSEPVLNDQSGWQRLALEFAAPQSSTGEVALYVTIQRQPKFSFDDPMRGRIWFDDFSLVETGR